MTAPNAEHPIVGRVAYGSAVAASAGLLSFVIVVLLGPNASSGEHWEGMALSWFCFGIPIMLVTAAASSAMLYPFYVTNSRLNAVLVYLANVLLLAGIALMPALSEGLL